MSDEVMLHGELIRMQKDLLDAVDAKEKAEAELAKYKAAAGLMVPCEEHDGEPLIYSFCPKCLLQAEAELAEAKERYG